MKTLLMLGAIALVAAVQPVFATPQPPSVPDGGATALLTAISLSGIIAAKNFIKPKR